MLSELVRDICGSLRGTRHADGGQLLSNEDSRAHFTIQAKGIARELDGTAVSGRMLVAGKSAARNVGPGF